jgi:hypothetical protein
MKIAIIELTEYGHYTFVESIANVFAADENNLITIFTDEKGYNVLKHLENEQIKLVKKENTEEIISFLNTIKSFDRVIVTTLEPYMKKSFQLAQAFLKTDFDCPIYFVIHNIDFWFQQSWRDKLKNIFYQLPFSTKELTYRLKVYFYYAPIIPALIRKIKLSKGRFITMSDALKNETSRFVPSNEVSIIPFSIFNNAIQDKSTQNPLLRVCIPGFLSTSRRDYDSIFTLLENDTHSILKNNIEWDLLGGINETENGHSIFEKAQEMSEKGHKINVYDKMLSIVDFDSQLSKADIVMGNLYLQQGANSVYGKSKETGTTFTMIKAAKPGLMPAGYNFDDALKTSILQFDNYEEVQKMLIHLRQNPSELMDLKLKAKENSLKYTPLSIYNKIEGTNSF